MRFIIYIIAIMAFCLSAVPCANNAAEFSTEVNHTEHAEHTEDHCTPFCTCACCGIAFSMGILSFKDTAQKHHKIVSRMPMNRSLYKHAAITSIWRPPALIK